MSTEASKMRKPVTRANWPTDKTAAEFEIDGNQPIPTAITDVNVYPVPYIVQDILAGKTGTDVEEVEEFWQWKWRTDNVNSDAIMVLWFHDIDTDEWYPSAKIHVMGSAILTFSSGGAYSSPGVLGTDYIGVQVTDHVGSKIQLVHRWS